MEKLKASSSKHALGNKENVEQEVGIGFERVFVACCDNGKAICSKQEWRKFVATLQHQGLVSKKELKVLDRMWAEITEAAIATGAAKKKGAPLLTFTEFTDRLLRLYKVPRDKEIQKTIQNLTDQANSLSTLFKEWQIETLNEVQMPVYWCFCRGLHTGVKADSSCIVRNTPARYLGENLDCP